MAFDPDAYLGSSSGFDPDAYLAATPPPAAPRSKSTMEKLVSHPLTRGVQGIMEAGTELATGLGAQALGGLGGIAATGANLIAGKPLSEATDIGAQVVQNAGDLAYKSRTREGKALTQVVALPFQKAAEGWGMIGGAAGEAVGGEQGRIAGESLGKAGSEMLMAAAPGPAMLKQARAAAVKPPTYQEAAATYPGRVGATQMKQDVVLSAQREAAEAAKRQGVTVDLPSIEPKGMKTKLRRAVAHKEDVQGVMAEANQGIPEMKLKEAVGIASETPLSHQAVLNSREALAGPKNTIIGMEGFLDDGTAVSRIRGLVPERTVGMGREHAAAVEKVNEIVRDIGAGNGSGSWAMGSIESLRKAARDIYGRDELTPEARNTAEIYKGTSDAIEGMVERNLATTAPDLLNQYRTNRQGMAQTYLLEDILDQNTGKVSLDKLARQTSNDPAITGTFRDFGRIYANSPESFKVGPKESPMTRFSRYTIPGALGAGLGTAVMPGVGSLGGIAAGYYLSNALSKRAARSLASPEHQAGYTAQRGPVTRESMGYRPDAPPPFQFHTPESPSGPLPQLPNELPLLREGFEQPSPPLAPIPEDIMGLRGTPMESEFAPRGVGVPEVPTEAPLPQLPPREPLAVGLGEAPPDMMMQALRTRHDVPTTDFPLRQEVLQQPEISAAIDNFRAQSADLQSKVNNASGMWKQRYQAELDALQQEFAAGMRQLGIDTPQQAIGFQPLYEGGGTPKLTVETVKALRDFPKE